MKEATVRRNIEEIRQQLAALEERKATLEKLLKDFEALDALNARERAVRPTEIKGKVSLRSTILKVLMEATAPLSAAEIWDAAWKLGARTAAAKPTAIVDLTAYQLKQSGQPLEKTAPLTWRYFGKKA